MCVFVCVDDDMMCMMSIGVSLGVMLFDGFVNIVILKSVRYLSFVGEWDFEWVCEIVVFMVVS